ncbi:MAG: penicillin-binding protein 2 [Patescibacteria group bacterium]|nr:penicillin-binding protein 2 [Patescibacteria group bacterium]
MAGRIKFLILLFLIAYGIILFRLYDLQIQKNSYYLARANSQYGGNIFLKALRGGIYFKDKNNNLILGATNKNFPIIYAVPKEIEDSKETFYILKNIIPNLSDSLQNRLAKKNSSYALILKKAPPEIISKIKDLNLKGIYINEIPERFYPFSTLASHVLGYVSQNDNDDIESGKYGIEKMYNNQLSGINGKIENNKIIEPIAGKDIILTIDANIQREAERILSSLVLSQKAKSGMVIVQNPQSGEILAMAGIPNFDPNYYFKYDISNFLNPIVSKIYEPGSVLKVITMAIGLETKKITPETTFFDSGSLILNGKIIKNWNSKVYGNVKMSNIIENSINTGAAFIQRQVGRSLFLDYLKKFGFDKKTNIDLPNEISGDLKSLEKNNAPDINFATASFGQGIAITPIELINSISAIANGGKLMRPYLNSVLKPQIIRENIISTSTAKEVIKMMVSAVDKAGVAKINGYSVAGKTGTAEVPDLISGGYKESYIHTYVGFAPAYNARFTILIRIDEPEGAQLAGQTVVPAFRELAQFILNYYNILPDRIE